MNKQGRDALSSLPLKTPKRRSLDRLFGVFSMVLSATPVKQLKVRKSTLSYRRAILVIAVLFVPLGVLFSTFSSPQPATALAPNKTLNFQGRLLSNTGALVADGSYNIEFKLYNVTALADTNIPKEQGACTYNPGGVAPGTPDGNCMWTETRYDTNGLTAGNDYRIIVKNGYFSVVLGDSTNGGTAFPSTIDWSQQLYMTMRVGGSTQTATPTWDTEMTPRIQTTAVPLAFMANNVNSGNTYAASTPSTDATIQSGNATGATSNTGNLILQSGNATATSGNITIDVGTGSSKGTISIGATNASSLLLGRASFTTTNVGNLTVQGANTTLGTSGVAGNLKVSDGSSNFVTLTASGVGTDYTLTLPTTIGSASECLQNSGTAGILTFASCGAGGSGVTSVGTFSATSVLNGGSVTGSVLNLAVADQTNPGLLSTVGQTIGGLKTFNGGIALAATQTINFTGNTFGNRPGSPTDGMLYYDTTSHQLVSYNSGLTKWVGDRSASSRIVAASDTPQTGKDAADYVGDGETSSGSGVGTIDGDQIQINQALSDVTTKGGTVYLMEGTYTIDASISIPNNVTLAGSGAGTKIRFGNFGATSTTITAIVNTDTTAGTGVNIRDLKLDGRNTINTSGSQTGIYFLNMGGGYGSTARFGANFKNITVSSFLGSGIIFSASLNNTITDSTFQNNSSAGLYLDAASNGNNILNNNSFANQYGLIINNSSLSNNITGNSFQLNTAMGVYLSSSNSNIIANNFIQNNGTYGINAQSSTNISILNNFLQSNTNGINLSAITSSNVTGNNVSSSSTGIYVIGSSNITFASNIVNLNTTGIYLSSSSNFNTLTANTFKTNSLYGIQLDTASANTVSGNNISSSSTGVYVLSGSQNTISGNSVASNTSEGIFLFNTSTNVVSNNKLYDNGGSTANKGISVNNSDGNSIIGNDIQDTSCSTSCNAIDIVNSTSDNNYLSTNTFTTSSGTAVISDLGTGTRYSNQTTTQDSLNVIFKQPNSATALQVQNTNSASVLTVNTTAAAVSVASPAATSMFSAKVDYTTGSSPDSVATGDFNKDGKLDLAITNQGSTSMSVFINSGLGAGQFGASAPTANPVRVDYTTGSSPRGIVAGDFDKDGNLDLVVVNTNSNTISIFIGSSTGTFAASVDYATGASTAPRGITAGDFNGDGKLDLAVTDTGNANISVFINSGLGAGQFGASAPAATTRVEYTTPTSPRGIMAGDFNKDGKLDLATANNGVNSMSVFINSGLGAGQFGAGAPTANPVRVDYSTGSAPDDVVAGDFNKDGNLDLAIDSGTSASVFIGTSTGAFAAKVDYAAGGSKSGLAIGDFNKDGNLDLVLTAGAVASVLNGTGAGTFGAYVDYATGGIGSKGVVAGDFNKDGNLDLAVANNTSGTSMSILMNAELAVTPTTNPSLSVYNNGTRDALSVKGQSTTQLLRMDGLGNTTFGGSSSLFDTKTEYVTEKNAQDIASADFNKDGKLDLVTTNYSSDTISVLLGNGGEGYAAEVSYPTGSAPQSVATADFDKDGDMDIVVTNRTSNTISILINTGAGVFAAKVDYTTGSTPVDVTTADLDKDGDIDIAVTNRTDSTVSVFLNSGLGTGLFGASPPTANPVRVDYTTGTNPEHITSADFDKDGDIDLAVTNFNSDTISILINTTGAGAFSGKIDYTTGSGPVGITSADFDKDGDVDIAVANQNGLSTSVFLNSGLGTGQFGAGTNPITATSKTDYTTGSSPRGITYGDFDKDGNLDLATANSTPGTVSVFLGAGTGGFAAKTDYTAGNIAYGITAGDFDNDGDTDIGFTNDTLSTLSILSNTTIANSRLRVLNSGGSANLVRVTNNGIIANTNLQIQNTIGSSLLSVDTTAINALTSNTSFEGPLTGWAVAGSGSPTISTTTDQAYVGNRSLQFYTGGLANVSARYTVGTALATNTTYTFSFYARLASGSASVPANFGITYARSGAAATETDCSVYTATTITATGWTRVNCTLNTDSTTPVSTAYIAIRQIDAVNRSLYIDSIQLEAGNAITQAVIATTGFESGTTGWSKIGSGASVTMTQDATTAYNGSNGLKLTVTTGGTRDGFKYNTANANPGQLATNSNYTLSFWAKASGSFSTFTAGYSRDGTNTADCKTSMGTVTTAWAYYSCNIVTDGTAAALSSYIYIVQTDSVTRNWWVDDVQLTNTTFVNKPVAYQEGSISINGVVDSSLVLRNNADSTNAFQVQNASGTSLFTADTLNGVVSIGATGSLLVSADTVNGTVAIAGAGTLSAKGTRATSTSPWGLVVSGNYAYTINNGTSFQIFDVSNPSSIPAAVSTTAVTGASSLNGIAISGRYAYLVDETVAKLFVYDLVNPAAPSLINTTTTYQTNASIAIQGKYAYISGATGLQIYDITNPLLPVSVSTLTVTASYGIMVKGRYAYVVGGGSSAASTLKVIDINNPASPSIVSTSAQFNALSVYVNGNYAYTTDGSIMRIYNISVPTSAPVQVGTINLSNTDYLTNGHWGMPYSIFVQGRHAYVAGGTNKVYDIDVLDPTAPAVLSSVATGSSADNVYISGQYLYATSYVSSTLYAFGTGVSRTTVENLTATSDLSITGALNVGNGATVTGDVGIAGKAVIRAQVNSVDTLRVETSAGNSILSVDTSGGNLNNIITNASFETDITGWSAKGTTPTTFARDVSKSYSGNGSLKVTTQATAIQGAKYATTLSVNTKYTASFYILLDSTSTGMATLAAGYSSDGTNDNTACTLNTTTLRANQWVRVNCSFTTPGTTASVPYFYIKQTDAVIHTFYIDGVLLQTDANGDSNYREGKLTLGGTVVSPVTFQSSSNSANALTVQNASGANVFNIDTTDSNLISNPGFEVNSTNWSVEQGSGTIGRDTSQAWLGSASLGITTSATANAGAKVLTANVQPTQLAISTQYTLSWYAKLSSGTFTDIKGRYSVDGGTTFIDCTPTPVAAQVVSLNGWTRYSCTFTTAATTPNASAYIAIVQTAATAHTFWIDGIQLEAAASATEYAAGNLFINATITSPTVFKNTSNSTESFKVQNAAAASLFTVDTLNGNLVVGVSDANTTPLVLDIDTDATYVSGASSNAGTVVDGGMFYSSTDHRAMCGAAGAWTPCNGLLTSNIATGSAIGNCTNTCASVGGVPIPANFCKPGKVVHIYAKGTWGDTTAAPTLGWAFYYGSNATTRGSDTPIGVTSPLTNLTVLSQTILPWSVDATIICFTTASMHVTGTVTTQINATAATTNNVNMFAPTTTGSLTTTSAANIYLFPTFSVANAANIVTMHQFIATGN